MTRQLEIPWGPTRAVRFAAGPLATERLLLADLSAALGELGPRILSQQIFLVVPSRSLRLHLLTRLLAHRGRAVAGLACRTHHSFAARIVAADMSAAVDGPDPCTFIARRLARREPDLAQPLEHLENGYGSVVAAVRDLLDAGMEAAHEEAVVEALTVEGSAVATPLELARARAIARVAAGTAAALEQLGLERSSTLLAAATAAVRDGRVDPPGAIFIYGYSDATGVATDFLQALVEVFDARVYLDRPPDPVDPERTDAGVAFSRRFSERLVGRSEGEIEARSQPPTVSMFKAFGAVAEVRHVGREAARLIAAGCEPERIAVVARNLEPYLTAIRTHFDRLGVPFSGLAACGPPEPVSYRIGALLDLLHQRGATPTERWLEAREPSSLAAPDHDLRLAFHRLGAGRLDEAARVVVDEDAALKLPVCHALVLLDAEGADDDPARWRHARRHLPGRTVAREARRAELACRHLEAMSGSSFRAGHAENLRALLADHLGWGEDAELGRQLMDSAYRVLGVLAPDFELDGEELRELLAESWAHIGASPLGGAGGGVQVLDVIEARARTFDHIFVLGMNRGRFPRTVREDPILTDSLRHVLGRSGHGVLPDLTAKRDGFLEERFLFAQLLAASPSLTLSWQEVDEEHAFQTPSPLVERLRVRATEPGGSRREPPIAPALFTPPPASPEGGYERSAWESAVLTGLFGDRNRRLFGGTLAVALQEAEGWPASGGRGEALAAFRVAVLSELDPPRGLPEGERTHRRLGPYLGLVGAPSCEADPRRSRAVNVTALEAMARCPWQHFLRRFLAVEPAPDPLDLLPAIEARLMGNLVHDVLDRLVVDSGCSPADNVDTLRTAPSRTIAWPPESDLARTAVAEASRRVRREGIALDGFARVLARRSLPFLAAARDADWPTGDSSRPIVATEQRGELEWRDGDVRIRFRADRVDRQGADLVLTDYKTGAVVFGHNRATLGPRILANAVASGTALQAVVYRLAGGGEGDRGRYLFLHPDVGRDGKRDLEAAADDDLEKHFRAAVEATLGAWEQGIFFPRLEQPDRSLEPRACQICDVAEACLRGDSGTRGRLRDLVAGLPEEGRSSGEVESSERTLAGLWRLPLGTRRRR